MAVKERSDDTFWLVGKCLSAKSGFDSYRIGTANLLNRRRIGIVPAKKSYVPKARAAARRIDEADKAKCTQVIGGLPRGWLASVLQRGLPRLPGHFVDVLRM